MNILIASIFRNSEHYIERYFNQVRAFAELVAPFGHNVQLVLAEGDSNDKTFDSLMNHCSGLDVDIIKVDHGGPTFGSIDHEQRWRNISFVCNRLLERISYKCYQNTDIVIYIESDLLWASATIFDMVNQVASTVVDAIAPMCFHLPTGVFYDTWGHRANGIRFEPYSPYHQAINGSNFLQLDSAGSCIVMKYSVAFHSRFNPPELGIVGFCQNMRNLGYALYLDPGLKIFHP